MDSRDKQVLAAAAVFKQALKIMQDRVKKYGDPADSLSNFRFGAEVADTDVTHGIMTRFGDKLGRIKRGLTRYREGLDSGVDEFKDEPFRDSVIDAINYLAILLLWIETYGGAHYDEFLEEHGMIPPAQQELPLVDEKIQDPAVPVSYPKAPGVFKRIVNAINDQAN